MKRLPDGSGFFVASVEVPKNTSTNFYSNIPDDIKQAGIDYGQKHDTEVVVREFSFIDGAMWAMERISSSLVDAGEKNDK